jgi:putative tricarboxylic transport membrane protein
MDRRLDMALAAAFMVVGAIIIWQATSIRIGMMRDPIGPRTAFYLCGGVLVLGGAITILTHWRAMRAGRGNVAEMEGTPDTEGHPASFGRAAALIGLCFLYAIAFSPLGYLLATPLFIVAALATLGQRRWMSNLIVAVVFTLASYVVFARILNVRMPHGPLTELFRSLGWIML